MKELTAALFDTLLPLEDHETQEAVTRTLTLATDQVDFDILGNKIADIITRNPDYAEDMLVHATREKPSLLAAALSKKLKG